MKNLNAVLTLFWLAFSFTSIVSAEERATWPDPDQKIVNIQVTSQWDDSDNQDGLRPECMFFHLLADGVLMDTRCVDVSSGWTCSFDALPYSDARGTPISYSISQSALQGYEPISESHEVIDFDPGRSIHDINICFTEIHVPRTVDVPLQVCWNDGMNCDGSRPDHLEIQLMAGDLPVTDPVCIDESYNWAFIWDGLPAMNSGKTIPYTIKPFPVPPCYECQITGSIETGFILTLTHLPAGNIADDESEVLSIRGLCSWNDADNQDGLRPDNLTVMLLANGREIARAQASEQTGWFYCFDQLPRYSAGSEIYYSLLTDSVPDYEFILSGYNLTAVHTPACLDVNGRVIWQHDDNTVLCQPGSVSVTLCANGQPVLVTRASEEDLWCFSFLDLPVCSNGKEISYTLLQEDLPQFYTIVSGNEIINRPASATPDAHVVSVFQN